MIHFLESLDAILTSPVFGLFVGDTNGTIYSYNPAFLSLLGYKQDESPKLNWRELTPKQYRYKDRLALETLQGNHEVPPYEKAFVRVDGCLADVLTGLVPDKEKKNRFIAYVINISSMKEKQRKAQENLYFATHELKTPLTSLKGFLNLLDRKMKKKKYEELEQYVSMMMQNLKRIEHLTRDISQTVLTDKDQFDLQISTFHPADLITSAVKIIVPTSKRHTIKMDIENMDCSIIGDWVRLEQVITNLLTNAIKYSPNADTILVKAECTDDTVQIQVTDFGVGILQDKLDKIFDPFYRIKETANSSAGFGIGLYLSAEVVKRHNGRMTVTSNAGNGTTFTVYLPVSPTQSTTYEKKYTGA